MTTAVDIGLIRPNPYQSRETMDPAAIEQLAAEIREQGLWDGALRARAVDGGYQLVFGHRRLEALRRLGRKQVNLEIVTLSDHDMALQSIVENVQRQGLSDLEKSKAIRRLVDMGHLSIEKVGEMLGYSPNSIREFIDIAKLDEATQQAAAKGGLSRTAIREAGKIGGAEFIRVAAQHKLNRDDLDAIAKEVNSVPIAKRETIRKKLAAGTIYRPEQARREARRITAPPKDKAPPDLHDVILRYTIFIKGWRKELRAIAPYRAYIDLDPTGAEMFRREVRLLIADLQALL